MIQINSKEDLIRILKSLETFVSSQAAVCSDGKIKIKELESAKNPNYKKINTLYNHISNIEGIIKSYEESIELLELLEDFSGNEYAETYKYLVNSVEEIYTKSMFSVEDNCSCFITIRSGAGGLESQDWTGMLMKMYIAWATRHKFKWRIVDKMPGESNTVKYCTLHISGEYVYGLLKREYGTHRLVRYSPFNAQNKRQTSFSSVEVLSETIDDEEIIIRKEDIRIDTYRSSGAGGQHVNTTDSAVRITHIPTGIIAKSQDSRSQHQNKETAMDLLKSRLYKRLEEEKRKAKDENVIEASWGTQIRSYTLHPDQRVKDNRTNYGESNFEKVMDGYIDEFLRTLLTIE